MPSTHALRAGIARAVRDGHDEEAARLRATYFTVTLATKIQAARSKTQFSPEQAAYLCDLITAGQVEEGGR